MLPAGAFAVALFISGAQIMLPAPAFVEQGRVWAPGREVLVRLGCPVRWDAQRRALVATRGEETLVFPEQPPPWPTPATPAEARFARRVGNLLYLPLVALRAFGLRPTWEAGRRRVVIRDPTPVPVSLAAVLNNPAQWLDRTVMLSGDYLGWDNYQFCYATAGGPPVSSGDWVLRTEDGALYCTPDLSPPPPPAQAGLALTQPAAPLLTPYSALGRRLSVTGVITLTPAGAPYLRHGAVSLLTGRDGVSCLLHLSRLSCAPGGRLGWELVVYNPGPTSLALPTADALLVSVAVPGGSLYVSKQSLTATTLLSALPAQDEWRASGVWSVPADAPPGAYAITVAFGSELRSISEHFDVVPPPMGAQP